MTSAVLADPVAVQAWTIDPAHTEVEFSARHLMISNVKGRFDSPKGSVTYDPSRPDSLELDVSIPVGTIDTQCAARRPPAFGRLL